MIISYAHRLSRIGTVIIDNKDNKRRHSKRYKVRIKQWLYEFTFWYSSWGGRFKYQTGSNKVWKNTWLICYCAIIINYYSIIIEATSRNTITLSLLIILYLPFLKLSVLWELKWALFFKRFRLLRSLTCNLDLWNPSLRLLTWFDIDLILLKGLINGK